MGSESLSLSNSLSLSLSKSPDGHATYRQKARVIR